MKKLINNLLILVSISLFFVSCDKEDLTLYNSSATTTLSLSATEVILDKNNAGQDVLTLNWSKPDYGFDAGASYSIILSANGKENTISAGTNLSKSFETVELNKILQGLDFKGGVKNTASIKIQATLSETTKITSNSVDLDATAYEDKLDLSTSWGVVGSATTNGWNGPDMPFYKTSTSNVFVAYVDLSVGEIKFRENNDWANNYGDDGADGTLEAGGANIAISTAGTYKITFDLTNLNYTVETYSWGLVGSATTNGWNGPDMNLTYDSYSDTWKAIVTLVDGEMKVRQNNDWAVNYGDDGANGSLEPGGANIAVTAGNYLVTVNINSLEYTIEPINIWGVVGSAAPNGWNGPDARFTLDYSKDDVWIINNITLTNGDIKFRTNDAWDVNYGDDGADGTLEAGGANITVTAGTYDIKLDFSDTNAPTYTLTQK
jgi:hypothetical protein